MGWLMWCYQLVCLQLVFLHLLSFANLCSNEQSSTLLHFKQLFSFSNDSSSSNGCGFFGIHSYPKMMDWKEDTDCCSWGGITCDRVTGHVIGLNLSCSWLHGTIPSNTSLFLLSHLQKLDLSHNDFNLSQIPSDFVRFPSLTDLNLSYSNFSGQVPLEISHLSKLISLRLGDLERGVLTLETLVMKGLVQNMSHLQELSLYPVNMSTVALGTLTNINLPSLMFLDLGYCELQGTIPSWLLSLPSLETIYLDDNQLSGPIPSSIFELVNLTTLYLSYNHLSGTVELSMFAKLKNLENLALSGNSLSISTTFKVNSSFPKLQYLSLSSCNISEFPEILSTADNVETLVLSNNKIHGHIPNWLFNISNLSSLHLSRNFLIGSIEQLPWKGLRSLGLSLNQLSGPIPSSIFELVNLTFLDLSSNHLSGTVELSMFAKLKNLDGLYLSYNRLSMSTTIKVNSSFPNLSSLTLSSCNITEFPEIFSTAENLQSLDLSDNKIHGHIPNWLFNIITLSYLNLSHNFLTGIERLPWKDLQTLDLHSNLLQGLLPPPPPKLYFFSVSHNILTGAIPSSFCNLSSLQYLDLSNNSLSGVIPQCLGNSTSIYVLDLKMNNFHGSIPQTFANGCQLTTLNLNSNRLAGSLPPSLANCGNLEVLDVGNNTINGTFPHWLATLPQLQVLILRSNRFYGSLGDSTKRLRFTMLRILDLSHNSFTGHLQTRFFRKFQAMMSGKNNSADVRYMGDDLYKDSIMVTMKGFEIGMQRVLTIFTAMDLSSNMFQGRILDVVGKLNSLIVLNFSHNNLVGHIPLSMRNLTQLESLDLSLNKLDGKIPQELTSLTFLSVLNVSYNHLVGLIPQGNQFHTFQNDSYFGNFGLCGLPMSETCSNDEPLESQPTIFHEEHDNSSWFDWKIVMMGYGSGIVIGLSIGYIVFSIGKPWWFVSMVERKVVKLTGSRRRRRN